LSKVQFRPLLKLVFLLLILPAINFLGADSVNARKIVNSDSSLCKSRDLITMIAFSTREYNVAICKDGSNSDYYYIGQDKQDTEQTIFLKVYERNNPYTGANPWLLKARNGEYTYQIAEFNPLSGNGYVSISVFKNGRRIYHEVTDTYVGSSE
jgi:hypothetical protein